jgi:hypothetical protein
MQITIKFGSFDSRAKKILINDEDTYFLSETNHSSTDVAPSTNTVTLLARTSTNPPCMS